MRMALKYKFLLVLIVIMFTGFGTFFYFARETFSEDKKLFVMDLNLTLLKAAISDVKLELRGRMDELQLFVPRAYRFARFHEGQEADLDKNLTGRLSEEVLAITFYDWNEAGQNFTKIGQYQNQRLLSQRGISPAEYSNLEGQMPLPLESVKQADGIRLTNRSLSFNGGNKIPILSVVFNGTYLNKDNQGLFIAVDLVQDFLQKQLQQSELAELFLVTRSGLVLSHPDASKILAYAATPLPHPIVQRLQQKQFPRESLELMVNDEPYLCNVSETGFTDIFAVSQIKKSEAFAALTTMLQKTLQMALLIGALSLILSVLFASRLTANIRRLKLAADEIGKGNWDIKLRIQSGDEVQSLGESFEWMTSRLTQLMQETAQKARMEEELATASLVQSTLLTPPHIPTDAVEIAPYYHAASETGGDFWDAFIKDGKLTIVIGDATGHGAPAAIVTAVAKACIATLNDIYQNKPLTPEEFLSVLNQIVFDSCKGKLLMTMCIVQVDLTTGELTVSNAGHESPLWIKKSDGENAKPEVLFVRGERLGFQSDSRYETVRAQINLDDVLLLYSDGISEAPNTEGKPWGERALKKAFSQNGVRELSRIRDEIVEKNQDFTKGARQEDDITFVLFRWHKVWTETRKEAA